MNQEFDLTEFNDYDDKTAASRVFLGWIPGTRHNFAFEMAPYEMRNQSTLTETIDYGDSTYNPGEVVDVAYQLYEFRLRYMYNLIENEEAWVRVGAALSYIHSSLELESKTTGTSKKKSRFYKLMINPHL